MKLQIDITAMVKFRNVWQKFMNNTANKIMCQIHDKTYQANSTVVINLLEQI